jgi:hypothetical protein
MVDCMPSCMSQGIKGNIWDNTMSKGGNGAHKLATPWTSHIHGEILLTAHGLQPCQTIGVMSKQH